MVKLGQFVIISKVHLPPCCVHECERPSFQRSFSTCRGTCDGSTHGPAVTALVSDGRDSPYRPDLESCCYLNAEWG
ncbi:hypothetical protein RRG08_020131 [Elysia crispata]|uniref:Uncharacterized protein n=1 Tax=Elysia crispata TaxID=231223 RepID=A0AAE1A570_9GAST|nr:hypothetical protein RRG08_020131 [Elysia crispata]